MVACSMYREKLIGSLGFPHRGEYIGERVASEGGPGGRTTWWRGLGLAVPPYGVAGPWLPFVSALDSISCQEK
jgi:hypothetical protein